jgi:hypothetical protein
VLAGFVTNLQDIINWLLNLDKLKPPPDVDSASVERVATIFEPVAKDSGSNFIVNVKDNTGTVIVAPIIVNSAKANAVQNGARRYLGAKPPSHGHFEKELLKLHQMKNDPNSKTGDRGIIEKFSKKPVKLHFMNPSVKGAIVDQPENPFKMVYVVDGEVSTVDGQPGQYKIYNVHEALEAP